MNFHGIYLYENAAEASRLQSVEHIAIGLMLLAILIDAPFGKGGPSRK